MTGCICHDMFLGYSIVLQYIKDWMYLSRHVSRLLNLIALCISCIEILHWTYTSYVGGTAWVV